MSNETQTEFGVDAERELAANAGVVDALENDDCDSRFGLDFLVDMFKRIESDSVRLAPLFKVYDESLLMHDTREDVVLLTAPLGGTHFPDLATLLLDRMPEALRDIVIIVDDERTEFVNLAIDADINAQIARETKLQSPPRRPYDMVCVIDDGFGRFPRDPFIDALTGKEEPNDQRKGFYRDFEGKRLDGSYKRARRSKRR